MNYEDIVRRMFHRLREDTFHRAEDYTKNMFQHINEELRCLRIFFSKLLEDLEECDFCKVEDILDVEKHIVEMRNCVVDTHMNMWQRDIHDGPEHESKIRLLLKDLNEDLKKKYGSFKDLIKSKVGGKTELIDRYNF